VLHVKVIIMCNSNLFLFFFFFFFFFLFLELVHLILSDIYMSIDWLWKKRKRKG
jgi:hypothetical protein